MAVISTYSTGSFYVSVDERESTTCPGCGGAKSKGAGRCWKCAGYPAPRRRAAEVALRSRGLNALWYRYMDQGGNKLRERPSAEVLLRWAAQIPDHELLLWRNVGPATLAQIRAHVIPELEPDKSRIAQRSVAIRAAIAFGEWPISQVPT